MSGHQPAGLCLVWVGWLSQETLSLASYISGGCLKYVLHHDNIMFFSVSVLANNALRAHHASAHGGGSTNGLSDILLIFLK